MHLSARTAAETPKDGPKSAATTKENRSSGRMMGESEA
jgi:hypothetical protein